MRAVTDPASPNGELAQALEAAYDALLARAVADLLPETTALRAVETAFGDDALLGVILPVGASLQRATRGELRGEKEKVGDYVPEEARVALARLVAEPKLLPPSLVHHVVEQDALEEVLRDVLFDALREFNDRVNPFFAEWGLPGLLKKLMPLGFGAVSKSLEAVKGEFDRRLEPEMRKFLQTFSKKALRRTADILAQRMETPAFAEVRRAGLTWLYDQPVGSLVDLASDPAAADLHNAGVSILKRVGTSEHARVRRAQVVASFYRAHGARPLGALLAEVGLTARPDFDLAAALARPLVDNVLRTGPARAWLEATLAATPNEGATPP